MKRIWVFVLRSVVVAINLSMLFTARPAVAAACDWNGNVSTVWENGNNWTGCTGTAGVPADVDPVTIPGTPANQPTISSADVTIAGLTLNSGATLTIASGRTLTVNGDISLNADGGATTTIDNAGALVATTGTLTTNRSNGSGRARLVLSANGTWTLQNITTNSNTDLTINGSPTIHIKGDVSREGTLDPGTSTIIFDSGGIQTLSGGSSHYFYNLQIGSGTTLNHISGTSGVVISGNFTSNGTFYQNAGSQDRELHFTGTGATSLLGTPNATTIARIEIDSGKTVDAGSWVITVANGSTRSPWINSGGTFNGQSSAITFNTDGANAMTSSGADNFGNVIIAATKTLNAGSMTMNVAGNWTNNGAFTAGTGTVTFNGTSEQTVGGTNATAFNNLTVNSGATVVLPTDAPLTVAGTMTNNGQLRQTRTVSAANTVFLNVSTDKYYGVEINPGSADMGMTTVNIKENQACNTTDTLVRRCFDITPTTAQNATVKFWYLNSEANGNTPGSMLVYRWTGSAWSQETGTYTRGTGGSYEWVQVTDVDQYSVFGLDDAAPTAVTMFSFAPRGVHSSTQQDLVLVVLLRRRALLLLAASLMAVGVIVTVLWRRRTT